MVGTDRRAARPSVLAAMWGFLQGLHVTFP
jgi:hypothetical protein